MNRRFPACGRVLVVDDQPLAREVLCAMLVQEGFAAEACASGRDALQRVLENRYDAVLLDVIMPDLDGISVCRQIRDSGDLTTPVLLVTANGDRSTRVAGKQAGADDFLTKPVDPVEVGSRVRCLQRVRAWYDQLEADRDRFASELARAQTAILQIERMATVGNMASGLGHEVKNLAQVVQSLDDFLNTNGDIREIRLDLGEVGSRLDRLGRHLMSLGHVDEPMCDFDLCGVVERTLMLCRASGRLTGLTLRAELACTSSTVRGRPGDVGQIVLNLLGNAFDAVEGRPEAIIEVAVHRRGSRVRVEIQDNGPGLSQAALARLFEPYVTTKPPGRGTGLGLSVSRQIAEGMGGDVGVENRVEGGARAWLEVSAT